MLYRRHALSSKYGVSVRTHVHEEICIPLVVRHETSKHITLSVCYHSSNRNVAIMTFDMHRYDLYRKGGG